MQVNNKVFEVEQIVCGRETRGCQEYLVYWKGFDLSSATWEPVENLLSCTDLIEQFKRRVSPIPGANPFILKRTERTKTVHVKMLLTRKNKQKRPRKSMGSAGAGNKPTGGVAAGNKTTDLSMTKTQTKRIDESNEKLNGIKPIQKKRSRCSESEKLMRDTLIHESKTMTPEKNGFTDMNSAYNENSLKYNGIGAHHHVKKSLNRCFRGNESPEENLLESTIKKGYMKISLNNVNCHNLLTITMMDSFRDCLLKASKNGDVKAVLLTNNGDYFCSGIDYSTLMNCVDDKEYKSLVSELMSCIRSFLDVLIAFTKPIVCAVNGPTLEFGLALIVNSDFAYASSKASFDVVYSKIHLTPIGCLTQLLPKMVGNSMANSMLYLGGRHSAVAACDRGLVLDMYGVNSFAEDMEKKMSQLTSSSTACLETTKRLVTYHSKTGLDAVYNEELHEYQQALLTKEVRKKLKEDWTMIINLYNDI